MKKKARKPKASAKWEARTMHERLALQLTRERAHRVAGMSEDELQRVRKEHAQRIRNEEVGAKVTFAHPAGRTPEISDEDLARRWIVVKRGPRGPYLKKEGVSKQVSDDLAKEGITLSADRITKRVRPYLRKRGKWT